MIRADPIDSLIAINYYTRGVLYQLERRKYQNLSLIQPQLIFLQERTYFSWVEHHFYFLKSSLNEEMPNWVFVNAFKSFNLQMLLYEINDCSRFKWFCSELRKSFALDFGPSSGDESSTLYEDFEIFQKSTEFWTGPFFDKYRYLSSHSKKTRAGPSLNQQIGGKAASGPLPVKIFQVFVNQRSRTIQFWFAYWC